MNLNANGVKLLWEEPWRRVLGSQIAREAIWSLSLKVLSTVLGFLSTVLIARLLGAEGYGIYAYAYALVTLLSLPANAGLPNLVIRETARGMAKGRPEAVKGVWRWSGWVVTVISLGVGFVGGPFLVVWQGGLGSVAGQTAAWALLLVPLTALGNLRGAALRGLKRVIAGQLPELALRPGLLLLMIGGIAIIRGGRLSVPVVMALHAAASILAFGAGAWLLWRHVPDSVRYAAPVVHPRKWLMSTVTFALMAGSSVANNQASTVILGLFEPPSAVGGYRIAVQVANLSAFGLQAVNMVVAPRFAELWTCGEKARLQRLVTECARAVLAFNVFVTVAFMAAGRPFLRLVFGISFENAYLPLVILLAGQVVNSAAGSVGFLLNMTGHERDAAVGMGIAVAFNVLRCVVLVPEWGTVGAALATASAMALWNGVLWWRVRRRLAINSVAFPLHKTNAQ